FSYVLSAGSTRPLALLLLPVRCGRALVTPDPPSPASIRPFILHGWGSHAAPATWLRQPCSMSARAGAAGGRSGVTGVHQKLTGIRGDVSGGLVDCHGCGNVHIRMCTSPRSYLAVWGVRDAW